MDSQREPTLPVLLVDLDNVTVRKPYRADFLAHLLSTVGPVQEALCSAHRRVLRDWLCLLTDAQVTPVHGGCRPNGADRALMERARTAARRGVREFIVASNDGGFAWLARLGRLTVITNRPEYVSHRLAAVSRQVIVLPGPRDAQGSEAPNVR